MDDKPPRSYGASDGWVRTMVEDLKVELGRKLGRGDSFNVWLDRLRLDPTFVVSTQRVAPECRPEPIQKLIGFDFYRVHTDDQEYRLGHPVPTPESSEFPSYCRQVDYLSGHLSRRLEDLRAATEAPPSAISTPPTRAPLTAAVPVVRQAIYLAETTPDLRAQRDQLIRQLEQSGYVTRPASPLPRAPDAYRQAVREELAASLLFVQVLGPYTTDKRPDLPQGDEALQLVLAEEAKVPVLRWMDPHLERGQLDDPALFDQAGVIVCPFVDFKHAVEDQARRRLQAQTRGPRPGRSHADTLILICAAAMDQQAACDVGERLFADHGIGFELVDGDLALDELLERADTPYSGLMVIYGECDRG